MPPGRCHTQPAAPQLLRQRQVDTSLTATQQPHSRVMTTIAYSTSPFFLGDDKTAILRSVAPMTPSSAAPSPSAVAVGLAYWATAAPNRIAAADIHRSVCFEEIEAVAATLATTLAASAPQGSTDEQSWLPVITDRSVTASMALHGAIRAGRCFVPIESSTPRDRVADFFARLGHPQQAVVTRPEYAALLPHGVEAIAVPQPSSDRIDPVAIDSSMPGFVVFTSGSTGRPKAVLRRWSSCERRSNAHLTDGVPAVGDEWRTTVLQPFSFSPGLRSSCGLALGRSIHIADPASMSVDALLTWLDGQHIDELNLSATLAATFLAASNGGRRLPSVTQLRLGSEASSWELVAPLRRLTSPDVIIVTGYGASESGQLFNYVVGPDHPVGQGRIPIGTPNEAWRARLVPVDGDETVTQLVLGSPEALSYLDDPELTARRFLTDADGTRWWV
ncbi:MAG: AMP-binding protein, partial [Actinobacteria bacterium]|nr:AMP-binding protein [Actinomycetota bacterium]